MFAVGFNRWKQSDQSMMGWAVLTGCAAGLLAVLLKRTVGAMHFAMNGIAGFLEAPWWLGIGPLMGLLATRMVASQPLAHDPSGG